MLTLNQWKTTRRVDHVEIGPFNARTRGQAAAAPHLDAFDADVQGFALAGNNFDRVTVLGNILQRARTNYLSVPANTMPARYITAVNTLFTAAQADMNQICEMVYQTGRTLDLTRLAGGLPLAGKNVSLNVYCLAPVGANPAPGPLDAIIDQHILNANAAAGYQQAGITFARTNAVATIATQTAGPGSPS